LLQLLAKEKNNCKKTVLILSNHCFDFSGHSSASRPEIIPLWQLRWDLLKAATHEGESSKYGRIISNSSLTWQV